MDHSGNPFQKIWNELKRRHVFKVATVYAVAAWLIMQVADIVIPPLHLPAWVLTFLIVLILLGFPVALILAWAYQITPANVTETSHEEGTRERGESITRWKVAVVLVVIAGSACLVYFRFINGQPPVDITKTKSIAVLPFDNLTGDKDQDFFTDGIVEEILNHLAKIDEFNVTSRTSSMSFKTNRPPVKEIAKTLDVNYVIEGSLRKQGEQIRITVQLIDAATDKHLLSEEYDRVYRLSDLFSIQTEISMRVANVLKVKLNDMQQAALSKVNTENPQAYKLYLRGRNFWDKRTRESYDSAETCYKRAIDIDPRYALPYAGLAECYLTNQKGLPQTESIPIAREYARKALSIDATLCEAITVIGFIQGLYEYNWSEGKATLEKAIQCDPNYATAHQYLGVMLVYTGRVEEGLKEIRKALSNDPISPTVNHVLGRSYFHARKINLALEQLRKTLIIEPKYARSKIYIARCLIQNKFYPEAIELITSVKNLQEIPPGLLLSYAYAAMGNKAAAWKELQNVNPDHPNLANGKALAFLGLGEFDKALTQLELAHAKKEVMVASIACDPEWDPMRHEPRFKALLKKMNLE